jgi:hypothetical protein
MTLTPSERFLLCEIADQIASDAEADLGVANSVFNITERWPDAPLRLLAAAICLLEVRRQAERAGGFRQ